MGYMEIIKSLGKSIRLFRKARGMTQAEMAEYCDLSYRGYQDVENGVSGTVRASTIDKISKATGMDEFELFGIIGGGDIISRDQLIIEAINKLQQIQDPEKIEHIVKQLDSFITIENKQKKKEIG